METKEDTNEYDDNTGPGCFIIIILLILMFGLLYFIGMKYQHEKEMKQLEIEMKKNDQGNSNIGN